PAAAGRAPRRRERGGGRPEAGPAPPVRPGPPDGEHGLEESQRRAQAPRRHPELVNRLDLARAGPLLGLRERAQVMAHDSAGPRVSSILRREHEPPGPPGLRDLRHQARDRPSAFSGCGRRRRRALARYIATWVRRSLWIAS